MVRLREDGGAGFDAGGLERGVGAGFLDADEALVEEREFAGACEGARAGRACSY